MLFIAMWISRYSIVESMHTKDNKDLNRLLMCSIIIIKKNKKEYKKSLLVLPTLIGKDLHGQGARSHLIKSILT